MPPKGKSMTEEQKAKISNSQRARWNKAKETVYTSHTVPYDEDPDHIAAICTQEATEGFQHYHTIVRRGVGITLLFRKVYGDGQFGAITK